MAIRQDEHSTSQLPASTQHPSLGSRSLNPCTSPVACRLDPKLSLKLRTLHTVFLIRGFASLEDNLVGGCFMRAVSIDSWLCLSEARVELELTHVARPGTPPAASSFLRRAACYTQVTQAAERTSVSRTRSPFP